MKLKIGFADRKEEPTGEPETAAPIVTEPRKSVVRVFFEARGFACSYYNDRFDLHEGDIVFVEGKLEGLRGRVTEVSYNFKIRLSDYKRVTAKADAEVHGIFYPLADGFVSFDKSAIDGNKMKSRYIAPSDGEYVTGDGEAKTLSLGELEKEIPFCLTVTGHRLTQNTPTPFCRRDAAHIYYSLPKPHTVRLRSIFIKTAKVSLALKKKKRTVRSKSHRRKEYGFLGTWGLIPFCLSRYRQSENPHAVKARGFLSYFDCDSRLTIQ